MYINASKCKETLALLLVLGTMEGLQKRCLPIKPGLAGSACGLFEHPEPLRGPKTASSIG